MSDRLTQPDASPYPTERLIRMALHPEPSTEFRHIDSRFDIVERDHLRQASVLVPLLFQEGGWSLLFTRRTDTVQDHKGQVAFPGGAAELVDTDRAGTALREAWEEIGLEIGGVRILGYLDNFLSITDFVVTPVVGVIPWPFRFVLNPAEVSRIFTIPVDWLADPINYEERNFTVEGNIQRKVIFYKPFDGEILWGLTARITLDLIEAIQRISPKDQSS